MARVRLIPPNVRPSPDGARVDDVSRRARARRRVQWCTAAAPARVALARVALARVALAGLPALALGGCGAGSGVHAPSLAALPTVPGFRVVVRRQSCDSGAAAYCALALVAVDPRYRSSEDFMAAFGHHLRALGWQRTGADTGDERAAASPGDRLRVTYATAYGDLKATARGWTHRPDAINTALSRAFFGGQSVLSILLELGPSAT